MEKILLSEIEDMPTPPAIIRGIVCDTPSFAPPNGVRIAGFLYDTDPNTGEYAEDLLDTLIAWGVIARTNVKQERKTTSIVEIPFGTTNLVPEHIIHVAAAGGVSITLLPPEVETEENWNAWRNELLRFGKAILNTTHFGGRLYPFSDLLEPVFLENISTEPLESVMKTIWDDKDGHLFHKTYFASVFSGTPIERFIDDVRTVVIDHFGGLESFRKFSNEIPALCWKKTEEAVRTNIQAKKAA